MRHKNEWNTCDRCGAIIKELPLDRSLKSPIYRRIFVKPKELEKITCDTFAYISDKGLISPKVGAITIVECSNIQKDKIDLCPECVKDFNRFMKNE